MLTTVERVNAIMARRELPEPFLIKFIGTDDKPHSVKMIDKHDALIAAQNYHDYGLGNVEIYYHGQLRYKIINGAIATHDGRAWNMGI